jgi:SAM-dependent methyltransferase
MTHDHGSETRLSEHDGRKNASSSEIWLAATWPFIRDQLPAPPARVIELGCGGAGGHVPALLRAGYDAMGVDPEAPEAPQYRREAFENYRPDGSVDTVVASLSLHHVEDLSVVLDHVSDLLRPGGSLVVIEWISEAFDDATAQWCFRRRLRDSTERGAWLGNPMFESGLNTMACTPRLPSDGSWIRASRLPTRARARTFSRTYWTRTRVSSRRRLMQMRYELVVFDMLGVVLHKTLRGAL